MKKVLPILVVGVLVLSGLGAVGINTDVAVNKNDDDKIIEKSEMDSFSFSSLIIEDNSEYIDVRLKDISTYLATPGCPMIPKVVKSFELPFGVRNVKVEITVKNVKDYELEKEISPAPQHIPLIETEEPIIVNNEKNEEVYASDEPYPSTWYNYRVTCGLNDEMERVTHVVVSLYAVRCAPALNKLFVAEGAEIKITYNPVDIAPIPTEKKYDLVIIAPRKFSLILNRLKTHKNRYGVETFIKTTESIYRQYREGRDKPEKIKLFIEEAMRKHDIKYVLLVGGLNNVIWANPREHPNYGARWYHVPVRYHNFYDNPAFPLTLADIYDPGIISDLYYADIYKQGGEFNDWDPNGDGIIAAWGMNERGYPDVENDTGLDLEPDIAVGRLACRNKIEVISVVNKIINYERTTYGQEWFKRMVVIAGDGFLDQEDLDFQWDTNELPDGEYTIYATSKTDDKQFGTPDVIHITLDRTQKTNLTFNHDDHLRVKKRPPEYEVFQYPDWPIAEIVSVSEGNTLGYDDVYKFINESQAYCNTATHWADLNYTDGILHIRGKTYDPSPYGNTSNIFVMIHNDKGEVVFSDWRNGSEMYYEHEWITGEKELLGGGGALFYMPEEFERESIFASNGTLNDRSDIISALNKGWGFVALSGHGSPVGWSDHYPGIPGDRRNGGTGGLSVVRIPEKPFQMLKFMLNGKKKFPMEEIANYNKLPIIAIGGCHNSQFNVTMIPGALDLYNEKNTWCHGAPVPECFSWYLVKMPRKGAIATLGNTGLGYGIIGKECNIIGLDGGINIEFFKQYAEEYNANGSAILGDVYVKALKAYHTNYDMEFLDHAKTLTQWVLLGDPSLMIGGYDPSKTLDIN